MSSEEKRVGREVERLAFSKKSQMEIDNEKTLKERVKKKEKELQETHQKTIGHITSEKKTVEESL